MHRLALAGLLVAMFSVLGAGRVQAASVEKSTSVRDIDHPARHPFQAVCNGTTAICNRSIPW